jgi:Rrf2 family protein
MLKVSDAANLALHAMAVLAATNGGGQTSVAQLAKHLQVSEHHLAKVMQRLSKQGLVKSRRGPRGGFVLGRPAAEIRLIEIFEALEGPMPERRCLLDRSICDGTGCLMGDLVHTVNDQVRHHLTSTTLAAMGSHFRFPGGAS